MDRAEHIRPELNNTATHHKHSTKQLGKTMPSDKTQKDLITSEEVLLGVQLVESVIKSAIAYGDLDLSGLNNQEARKIALKYAEQFKESDNAFESGVIDHRDKILIEARNFASQEKYDFAMIQYALWWEHWINNLLQAKLFQKGISGSEYNKVIKSLNNIAKSSWFLKLLDLPAIDTLHLNVIKKITEKRNSFSHYKYPTSPLDPKLRNTGPEEIESIENTIEYLCLYENENLYSNFKLFGH